MEISYPVWYFICVTFIYLFKPVDPSLFLDNYDLSTATPHLISSVPGVYVGESAKKYGHIRLRELVAKAGWPTTQTQVSYLP